MTGLWNPTSRKKRARYGAPRIIFPENSCAEKSAEGFALFSDRAQGKERAAIFLQRAAPVYWGCPWTASVCAATSCGRLSRWFAVAEGDHRRVRHVGIERRVESDGRADGGNALERGLHVDREVRLLALLVVFGNRKLDRISSCRNHHTRHFDPVSLHHIPNLLRILRLTVEQDEFLVGKAKRLEIRSRSNGLRGKIGGRGWRRSRSRVIFRRRKEIGLRQSLDCWVAVHAAVVLVVEVLGRLFDLRLGLRGSELRRPGQKPGSILEVWRGLLRIGLSQKVSVIESRTGLRLGQDRNRLSAHW